MIEVTSTVTINPAFLKDLKAAQKQALEQSGEAVRGDLIISQTMPMETGQLQDESTFVDMSKSDDGEVSLTSSTPYARRLYFHPEYNFRRDKNPNAGGRWLDPYLAGGAKQYVFRDAFAKLFREGLKSWLT